MTNTFNVDEGFIQQFEKELRNSFKAITDKLPDDDCKKRGEVLADGLAKISKCVLQHLDETELNKASDCLQEMMNKGLITPREIGKLGNILGASWGIVMGYVMLVKTGALGKGTEAEGDEDAMTLKSDLQFQLHNRHSSCFHNPQDEG